MAQALTAFVIFIIVAGGVMVTLSRRTRTKMQESAAEEVAPPEKPSTLSRRQQRIVSTLEPTKELPSIEQLVADEARETGVNTIPGGEGLDLSLKLRVYWRDEIVRQGCTDGMLEYRIDEGVDPEQAETEDVRLVCVRNGVVRAGDPAPAEDPEESDGNSPNTGDVD